MLLTVSNSWTGNGSGGWGWGGRTPGIKEIYKTECKFKIIVSPPPVYIFIWRIRIAITYIALNSNGTGQM